MGGRSSILAFAAAAGVIIGAGKASAEGCTLGQIAQLPVTMEGLSPVVPAKINGTDVRLVADSGAFFSMLSPPAAQKLKLPTAPAPFQMRVMGATGEISVELAKAKDFTVLDQDFKNADFLVGGPDMGLETDGLLGANLLNAVDAEYDLGNGVIRLFREKECHGSSLAYWAKAGPFSVIDIEPTTPGSRHIRALATVNGVKIHVLLDSGAPRSMLTTSAARRAGVRTDGPGVTSGGLTAGMSRRFVNTWLAPFQSFKIGDEEVRNTQLRIGDLELPDTDMLLGADFFLSHRIFVANEQRKLYLTYNGGAVFRLDAASVDAQAQAGSAPAGPTQSASSRPASVQPPPAQAAADAPGRYADEPTDASGFARRGKAHAARGELAQAISDLSRAIQLDPKSSDWSFERAKVNLQAGHKDLALADLDQSLTLRPDNVEALMIRGSLRLASKDAAGGRADLEGAAALNPSLAPDVGAALAEAGMVAEGLAQMDKWIAAHPKDPNLPAVLNNRCWARAAWGRELDQALADCNAALKLVPHFPGFLDSRGLAHLRLGQFDASIADYDEALKRAPKLAWSLYGRGLAKLKKGQKADGDADIKAALEISPKLPDEAKKYGLTP